MINKKELESILRCPVTHAKLSFLTNEELTWFISTLQASQTCFTNKSIQSITGVLKAKQQDFYYLVIEDIFYLLPHFAISLADPEPTQQHEQAKSAMKTFYDEIGWQKESTGVYQDAKDSEDLRTVSQEYIYQCHLRLKQHLPHSGKYLLDIASGPVQYPAYLSYSESFEYRICADMSLTALLEAKKKLGQKGIYLLCDITKLPLQENCVDGIVSLHTIYHVPALEQANAFAELYRVLTPAGICVVVYSWGRHSFLMRVLLLPFKVFNWLERQFFSRMLNPPLYFHAYPYQWFKKEIKSRYPLKLFSWRSVNVPFLKTYIHSRLGGKKILQFVFWCENKFPRWMGRVGAYPMIVIEKKNV